MNKIMLNTIGTPCKAGGGGNSGGGGSASSVEYWDISSNKEIIDEVALFFPWVRDDNEKNITSAWGLSTPNANITAVALDRNVIIALEGEKMTIGEFLESSGLSDLTLFGWKQITEEEFYNFAPDTPTYENGVYIQHIDGTLYTEEEWTSGGFGGTDANGVAVITDNARFVIAKTGLGNKAWSSDISLVDGIATSDINVAKTDFAGYNNTQLMLATDTSGAGYSCANYTFPNGAKGYLPALGEWGEVRTNKSKINSLLIKIGGAELEDGWAWSSTQKDGQYAWAVAFGYGDSMGSRPSGNSGPVRAFSALSL